MTGVLRRLGREGALPPGLDLGRSPVRPRVDGAFDVVVDAALACAGALAAAGLDVRPLAERLAAELSRERGVEAAEAAGPGLVGVVFSADVRTAALADALRRGRPGPAPGAFAARATLCEARRAAASEALARIGESTGSPAVAVSAWGGVRVAPPHAAVEQAADAAAVCGAGALRFALAAARPADPLRLDLAALGERWRGNAAFAVPYAHARLRSVLLRCGAAAQDGADLPLDAGDVAGLERAGEGASARAALRYPHALAAASSAGSAHPLAAYLSRLAGAVHAQWSASKDQPQLRFVNEEGRDLTSARLRSTTASALVLGSGLGILGLAAPDEVS